MADTPPSAWAIEQAMSAAMNLMARMTETGTVAKDEEDLFAILRQGGADIEKIIVALARSRQETICHIATLTERIHTLGGRRERYKRLADAHTETLAAIMDALGIRTHRTAEFTLSMQDAPRSFVVTDVDMLPPELVRVEKKPDKTAIGARLAVGPVPGAEFRNPGTMLVVRSK